MGAAKETVSRDFHHLVVRKTVPPGPSRHLKKIISIFSEYSKIRFVGVNNTGDACTNGVVDTSEVMLAGVVVTGQ
jgi:hypothetical protein